MEHAGQSRQEGGEAPDNPPSPHDTTRVQLAGEWRQTFQKDVIVDIICYRRNG